MGNLTTTALLIFFLIAFPFLKGHEHSEQRFFRLIGKGMSFIVFYSIYNSFYNPMYFQNTIARNDQNPKKL